VYEWQWVPPDSTEPSTVTITIMSLDPQPPPDQRGAASLDWLHSPSFTENFVPSEEEVLAAREVLLEHLPLDLTRIILNEAEYWPMLFSWRESDPPYTVEEGAKCYLVTPKIPEKGALVDEPIRVERVVFRTVSHDQGWASSGKQPNDGVYDESHTWFEAAIIRNLPDGAHADARVAHLLVGDHGGPTPCHVPNPHSDGHTWILQKNIRAEGDEELHEIEWDGRLDAASQAQPVDAETLETTLPTGSGRGRGFVRALQAGDCVAIYAKAQHPAWVNHVLGADVQVYYSF